MTTLGLDSVWAVLRAILVKIPGSDERNPTWAKPGKPGASF